jgi:hypothetical protein
MAKSKKRARTGVGKILREARQDLGERDEGALVP